MSKKHKKVCTTLNYIEHFLISYLSLYNYWMCFHFCLYFFDWYSHSNYEFCNRIKIKSKLNSIEVLISKSLIDSVIIHDEFVLTTNMQKEYDEMKEENKNLKT